MAKDRREPLIGDYPEILSFLTENRGRLLWEATAGVGGTFEKTGKTYPAMRIQSWIVGAGHSVIVLIHSDGCGWDAYVPASDSNKIDATIAALKNRL